MHHGELKPTTMYSLHESLHNGMSAHFTTGSLSNNTNARIAAFLPIIKNKIKEKSKK